MVLRTQPANRRTCIAHIADREAGTLTGTGAYATEFHALGRSGYGNVAH